MGKKLDSPASLESAMARIAATQHGVITTAQLLASGLSARMITAWTQRDRLHRVYRGVYAVGHTALSNEGRWMAAVLACGEDAVLSHLSAAEHWGLLKHLPSRSTSPSRDQVAERGAWDS